MIRVAQRTQAFGETIFSEITALAQAHGAVNLGQGFPDFAPPEFVLRAAREEAARGSHQYARSAGMLPLAEQIAARSGPSLGRRLDAEQEITVTVGATEALFAATLALLDPGDEAVLIEPFYDSYPANVAIAGGRCRFVPLRSDGSRGWSLDPDELRGAFSDRTRLVFVNTPHNPTGKIFSHEELTLIAQLCQTFDAVAISDEVYDAITFDGVTPRSLASLPGMWQRSVTIGSLGKTFSVTGWKIGWAIAPQPLSLAIRRIHQWIPFCVAEPLQRAAARVLDEAGRLGYYDELRASYQRRRDLLLEGLRQTGFDPLTPDGTYFVVADVSRRFGDRFADDVELCRHLIQQVGVAAIPPGAFYSDEHRHLARRLCRFCFCKEDQTLAEATRRLGA